jgi:hypothetical protein
MLLATELESMEAIMKKLLALLAIGGMVMFAGHSAFAYSTEQRDDTNADGTSKFQDPDEQKPAFMISPGGGPSGMQMLPFGAGRNAVTPPAPGEYDQGAAAFDRAYSHIQSR